MPDDPGDIATSEPVDDPEATALLSGEAAESSAAASVEDTGHRISAESPRQWAKRKRLELLDDLIRNLDILAYAEIATVYYLDNSFLRFALRSVVQLVYLLPRHSISPILPDPPPQQPYIGGIIGTNLFCLFCHAWFARPEAGEATRGYLHGGLMVDFVGQAGPSSRLRLVILDLLILGLQLMGLAASVKRRGWAKSKSADTAEDRSGGENAARGSDIPRGGQDHDAEERGQLRTPPAASSSRDVAEHTEESASSRTPTRTWAMADLLSSGQTVIAELYIWDTLREQHNAYANRALSSSARPSLSPELTAALRRRSWRFNVPLRS